MAGVNNLLNLPFPVSATLGGSGVSNPTTHGILVAQGSSPFATKVLTDGQLLIGFTGADPSAATLTAGTGISIGNASGSITITNTSAAGGLATVNETGTSVTMAANTQYINTGTASAQVTYTFPATAAQGATFRIIGVAGNTGGWIAQLNTSQTAYVGSTACSSAGTWTSGDPTDGVTFVCTVANTTFVAVAGVTQDLAWT
jgi:hypothetical protein